MKFVAKNFIENTYKTYPKHNKKSRHESIARCIDNYLNSIEKIAALEDKQMNAEPARVNSVVNLVNLMKQLMSELLDRSKDCEKINDRNFDELLDNVRHFVQKMECMICRTRFALSEIVITGCAHKLCRKCAIRCRDSASLNLPDIHFPCPFCRTNVSNLHEASTLNPWKPPPRAVSDDLFPCLLSDEL